MGAMFESFSRPLPHLPLAEQHKVTTPRPAPPLGCSPVSPLHRGFISTWVHSAHRKRCGARPPTTPVQGRHLPSMTNGQPNTQAWSMLQSAGCANGRISPSQVTHVHHTGHVRFWEVDACFRTHTSHTGVRPRHTSFTCCISIYSNSVPSDSPGEGGMGGVRNL